ncbi:MAG: hypothetical protein IT287_07065, partial [Bdellovibrionaceae bacterium]|nr:hypothetical protein [Pseudobdellovibrionaceae bacterium]
TVLVKKEVFLSHGGFREDFPVCEDYDLWLKLVNSGTLFYMPETLVIKHGGRSDQLSLMTTCMDYFRVKAIDSALKSQVLKEEDKKEAISILLSKCDILLAGYLKHNNTKDYKEILDLRTCWSASE